MSETALNAMAQQYLELTLNKSRYDGMDVQWYTEGPFWRRTDMRFSREYRILPDYEIADAKHGRALTDIEDECAHLLENLKLYRKTARESELPRVDYLIDHVHHLHVRTHMLQGEKNSYDQTTRDLYRLTAPAYDYTRFDKMFAELGNALPGSGDTVQKICDFRKAVSIPRDKIFVVLKDTTQLFHDFSMQRMTITGNSMPRVRVREYENPNMEFLSILFAYDYNHLEYERNFNLNFHWTVDNVMEYIGHEMEPGHITYYEKRLQTMIDTCWPEMAVVSQFSSSSAFTEGSARYAVPMCFDLSMEKQVDFEREEVMKRAGIDTSLSKYMPLWHEYCEMRGYARLEAERNVWDGVWTKDEAMKFLKKYAFADPTADESFIDMWSMDPGHFTSHDYARDVVKNYFNHVAPTPDEQWRLYEKLCCSHMDMGAMEDLSFRFDF